MKALSLEYYKIRRKRIWVMLSLFLAAEMIWASMSMSISISRSAANASWEALIFSIASMNGLFLPIISAIVVSRICDMEHKGNTWKMLMTTNIGRNHVYTAKYICANSLILYGILAQAVFIVGFGLSKNISGPLPFSLLVQFVIGTLLTTLAITALQQWLSLTVRNQAFALCLGMLGGFIGTTSGLFPAGVRHLFIWSYYMDLNPVTYIYSATSGTYVSGMLPVGLFLAALLMAAIFYFAGNIHASRQEI
ncbi:ABC transporter permease [Paenibacillus sp. ClWae2A]|uniref:ABC transporter permease n=1 Tax=Paenibacillus TaxID=44249 RepID=UPI0010599FFE|nr:MULTISPECIES: ABC transporter permease [Paenibacillus]MDT9722557.1 ABC transporter permease [Paenibacillus sp. ClWae2A]TDL63239.1 ABC transporter permease [Paenibacillus amylolyticus]